MDELHDYLIELIGQRLAGALTDAQLAKGAFDRFYELELDDADLDETAPTLAAVLDALMFADEPDFALEEAELARLRAQLQSL
jgi:hypothetical protein